MEQERRMTEDWIWRCFLSPNCSSWRAFFAFVLLGKFFSPEYIHDEEEVSFNFPNILGLINEWLVGNFFHVDLVDSLPTAEGVLY